MNSNIAPLKENYNNLNSKRKVAKAKGNIWKGLRRNKAL